MLARTMVFMYRGYPSGQHQRREGHTGGAAHPNWNIKYPYFTDSQCAKVITYTRKFTRMHRRKQTSIRTVARLDLARHPTILITSVAGSLSQHFFDKLNKIAKNLKIFMEIDLIKYYHLIFFS